jgi:hypothetical protein
MEISPQEIISTVQTFPIGVQKEIVKTLQKNLKKPGYSSPSEDEIERILLANGLISEIPKRLSDKAEENYEPIEIIGKPLSETILEERD